MILKWIKDKLGITALELKITLLTNQLIEQEKRVANQVASLKEYTRVDADVGIRSNNTIILTGVYHRKAYVHFYDIGNGEFEHLVDMLKEYNKHALIRNIDAPLMFRGVFDI